MGERQPAAVPRAGRGAGGRGGERTGLDSDITFWEIATLHGLGRIELGLPLRDWLEKAAAAPLVQCLPITPAVAADLASSPPTFPRDPADRIIASSARVLGATLLTQDGHIIDSGAVPTLA